MKTRLPAVPGLKSSHSLVLASHYNRVQLALFRLGAPLQLMLPGRRGFALTMDRDAWVCVDRGFNNAPILAWTEFHPGRRNSLVEPVPCRLIYYHAYANILVRTLLDDVTRILAQRMLRKSRPGSARVIPFTHERQAHLR